MVGFSKIYRKGNKLNEKTACFVIWICRKFTREEIEQIIQGLVEILANRNPEVKPEPILCILLPLLLLEPLRLYP